MIISVVPRNVLRAAVGDDAERKSAGATHLASTTTDDALLYNRDPGGPRIIRRAGEGPEVKLESAKHTTVYVSKRRRRRRLSIADGFLLLLLFCFY